MATDRNGLLPPSEVEHRTLLARKHPKIVGVPNADRLIAQGHHPFHPDRVVVLHKDRPHWFVDERLFPLCERIHEQVKQDLPSERYGSCGVEKLTLLVRAADIFATHYCRPDALSVWSRGLVWRETFSPTGMGSGCGLLHQFQPPPGDLVKTDNGSVDWWAFLIPSGTDFEFFDELPVYFLLGHLFEHSHSNHTNELNTWSLASRVMREPPRFFPSWHEFAQGPPADAAQQLNDRLFHVLEEFDPC
ncbi:MAG TPA: hypothetical protein PK867_19620 [Pirellulales bacterium]|nr:hypothetical protein [Pirellulales bacterium]